MKHTSPILRAPYMCTPIPAHVHRTTKSPIHANNPQKPDPELHVSEKILDSISNHRPHGRPSNPERMPPNASRECVEITSQSRTASQRPKPTVSIDQISRVYCPIFPLSPSSQERHGNGHGARHACSVYALHLHAGCALQNVELAFFRRPMGVGDRLV